jgi:hypothetical protein
VQVALANAQTSHLLRKAPALGHQHAAKRDERVLLRLIEGRVQGVSSPGFRLRFVRPHRQFPGMQADSRDYTPLGDRAHIFPPRVRLIEDSDDFLEPPLVLVVKVAIRPFHDYGDFGRNSPPNNCQ